MTGDGSMASERLSERARPVPVLVAASGASWERELLDLLAREGRRMVLVKRCLDLPDLLATAATGSSRAAVVSDRLAGLDVDSVARLRDVGVRVVAVAEPAVATAPDHAVSARTRLTRLGVAVVVGADALHEIPAEVAVLVDSEQTEQPTRTREVTEGGTASEELAVIGSGRLVAVWGPNGAPGRTTLALCLARRAADAGRSVLLLDADPYGGALAQQLAVLDGASGLLAATRMANTGQLDRLRLAGLAREVAPGLRLLTGLPRPDRWAEVRAPAFSRLLEAARELDELVVVDTGAGLPGTPADPFATVPQRDDMTLHVVQEADAMVVAASADPVGMTRLARALRDLREVRPTGRVQVLVNRMRAGLGWSEKEVVSLVARMDGDVGVSFLPEDRTAADRALVSGTSLLEAADPALRRALVAALDPLFTEDRSPRPPARRRRLLVRR